MGALVRVVIDACEKELDNVANSIYGEMKAAAMGTKGYGTGEAAGAVHIEVTGARSRFIGGSHPHLYWLNEGNGSGRIYPKNSMALNTRFGPKASVSTYAGIHFVEEIASHY